MCYIHLLFVLSAICQTMNAASEARNTISFTNDVLPALTKQGCASGSCHGSPHGKGGFALSLFGYDPRIDRVSLTRDGFNRRVNILEPEESLILKKPLLRVGHVGGRKLRTTDAAYAVLRQWVAQGAKIDQPVVECDKITISPGFAQVLTSSDRTRKLRVVAKFSDGTARDVTPIATFESSHPTIARVDPKGVITALRRGQAAVSVRYLHHLESVQCAVVRDVKGFAWKPTAEAGFVDRLVNAKLKQMQYLPSDDCGDPAFLRRVTLDLTGLLPSAEHARRFLADRAADKRARLVDELLDTEEFARFQALKKADLMRVSTNRLKDGRAELIAGWLTDRIRSNAGWDRVARELLTAVGYTQSSAPANYFLAIPSNQERTEMTAQIFMGSRVECAKCHNHPFENWTMRDYYRIGAVFARTRVEKDEVLLTDTGETENPSTKEVMVPWAMTAMQTKSEPTADRRAVFAAWLTKPGNPYFARVEVNRIWADLMGRGIVHPVDDFRSSNPPSNAPLLDALAEDFERSGYDRKRTYRLICNSGTYQRSVEVNRFNSEDDTLFSRARVRLLSAEQLKDAIGFATRSLPHPSSLGPQLPAARDRLAEYSDLLYESLTTSKDAEKDEHLRALRREVARLDQRLEYATQRPYPESTAFTTTFGQPTRETACTCERQSSPTLLQALELLNGGTAYEMARRGAANFAGMEDKTVIQEVYLSALSRYPAEKEMKIAEGYLTRSPDRVVAIMDLLWTVVNTREFLFQH